MTTDIALRLLQRLPIAISDAVDAAAALEATLRDVCDVTAWDIGQVWLPADGASLTCRGAWHRDGPRLQAFAAASLEFSMTSGIGLPGRVWATRRPVFITEIDRDGNFPRTDAARAAGLRTGMAVPVLVADEVVAVLEFFVRHPKPDDLALLDLVAAAVAPLGAVIRRKQAEDALRATAVTYRMLLDSVRAIVWRADPLTRRLTFVSREAEALLGFPAQRWVDEPGFWRERVHPDDRDRVVTAARAHRAGLGRDVEYRMRAADGRYVWLRDFVRVVVERDRTVEMIGVTVDITERKQSEEAMHASREELRALSARLEAVREDERTGIARELHDELGQTLTALRMDIRWLQGRQRGDAAAAARLGEMIASVDRGLGVVQRISSDLRPPILDRLGLVSAVRWHARDFERRTGLAVVVRSTLGDHEIPRAQSTALYRIYQEALTNVVRHAAARRVVVRLRADDGRLSVEIRDDGRGIRDADVARAGSLGLVGIRERARALGGEATIVRDARRGTVVRVAIPRAAAGERSAS